jgi:competence protein ComEC
VLSYFQGENIRRLDLLILTHPDADHQGELLDLTTGLQVDGILAGSEIGMPAGLPVQIVKAGDTVVCGEISLAVLSANHGGTETNNDSVVLSGMIGSDRWLFTGDAETLVENELIARNVASADMLKIGHHGSDSSTSVAWLLAVSPDVAIISVGEKNRYGHPTHAVLNRLEDLGIRCLRTDLAGTLTFTYFPFLHRCLVTSDDRDAPFNNEITRLVGFL